MINNNFEIVLTIFEEGHAYTMKESIGIPAGGLKQPLWIPTCGAWVSGALRCFACEMRTTTSSDLSKNQQHCPGSAPPLPQRATVSTALLRSFGILLWLSCWAYHTSHQVRGKTPYLYWWSRAQKIKRNFTKDSDILHFPCYGPSSSSSSSFRGQVS